MKHRGNASCITSRVKTSSGNAIHIVLKKKKTRAVGETEQWWSKAFFKILNHLSKTQLEKGGYGDVCETQQHRSETQEKLRTKIRNALQEGSASQPTNFHYKKHCIDSKLKNGVGAFANNKKQTVMYISMQEKLAKSRFGVRFAEHHFVAHLAAGVLLENEAKAGAVSEGDVILVAVMLVEVASGQYSYRRK